MGNIWLSFESQREKTYLITCAPSEDHYESMPIQIQIEILIFFIFSAQNKDLGDSLEPPRGGSNEYPQSMFLSRNKKK